MIYHVIKRPDLNHSLISTYRVNHDAKGGMELTDAKPKGHVEDNRSESVKDKDHEYNLRSRGRIVKS